VVPELLGALPFWQMTGLVPRLTGLLRLRKADLGQAQIELHQLALNGCLLELRLRLRCQGQAAMVQHALIDLKDLTEDGMKTYSISNLTSLANSVSADIQEGRYPDIQVNEVVCDGSSLYLDLAALAQGKNIPVKATVDLSEL